MIRLRSRSLAGLVASVMFSATAAFADDVTDIDRLLAGGQLPEALQRADQALAARPQDTRLRFVRGVILSEQGKNAEAIDVFTKLSAEHPELPEPHNNLAVLYGKQGQYDQARRSLEAAIRTNPSYATAYENLGDVYAKLASQAYSKALQIDGSNPKVAPKLSMIRDLFSPAAAAGRTVATAPAPRPVGTPPKAAPATAPSPAPAPSPAAATAPAPSPAPVPPAAAPAPAPAAAPPAVAAATPPPPPAAAAKPAAPDTQGPQAAALAWASAWSRKDLNGYFAAYTRDFSGGKTRAAWEAERRARIVGKRSISVVLSDFETEVKGDRATVEFRQAYRADALKVSSRKRLDMVRVSGAWLIQKESTGS